MRTVLILRAASPQGPFRERSAQESSTLRWPKRPFGKGSLTPLMAQCPVREGSLTP